MLRGVQQTPSNDIPWLTALWGLLDPPTPISEYHYMKNAIGINKYHPKIIRAMHFLNLLVGGLISNFTRDDVINYIFITRVQ